MDDGLPLPSEDVIRARVRAALSDVWGDRAEDVGALPIPSESLSSVRGALRMVSIELPEWAAELGVDRALLVPAEVGRSSWESVDWWTAAFMLLECWHERAWEQHHGPVHSYSHRLTGWDSRAWERAWVNRIGAFMARWANIDHTTPPPRVRLSHDVDALSKTMPIRIKQGVMRALVRRRSDRRVAQHGRGVLRFAFGRDDWNCVGDVLSLERAHGLRATFHVFADPRRRNPKRWLMDPGYRLDTEDGRTLLDTLRASGETIGLHPSFDSWHDAELLAAQRLWLEEHLGRPVDHVRQHWLRFSWSRTWAAQSAAGLAHDSTLMFNDRAGFRNSAALTWNPWDHVRGIAHTIDATPCCFMDSHRYDYDVLAHRATRVDAPSLINECAAVGGTMEMLWHPHSLSADYGWRPGFVELVEELT
jgi:hypothetical protein